MGELIQYVRGKLREEAEVNRRVALELEKAKPSAPLAVPDVVAPWSGFGGLITTERDVIKAFISTAFTCIHKRAQAIARLDYKFFRRASQSDRKELPLDHWLVQLFGNPSPLVHVTPTMVFKWIEMWLCLHGSAYIYTPLEGGPVPSSAWPLPANVVFPVLGAQGFITEYQVYGPKGMVRIPAYEICHFMEAQPHGDIVTMYTAGKSRTEAALTDIEADEAIKAYVRESLNSMMLPPWFVKVPLNVDPKKKNQFRADLKEKFKAGRGTREPLGFLDSDWTLEAIEQFKNAKDGQLVGQPYLKTVAAAYGVPIGFLDSEKLNNRATLDTLEYLFTVQEVEARGYELVEGFTRHFQQFEEGVEVDFTRVDRRDMAEVRADEQHRITIGISTAEEIRAERGLPPAAEKVVANELRGTVGGADLYFTKAGEYLTGIIPKYGRDAVIAIAVDFFGFDKAVAESHFPIIPDSPSAPAGSETPSPSTDDAQVQSPEGESEDGGELAAAIRAVLTKAQQLERDLAWKRYDEPAEEATTKLSASIGEVFRDLEKEVLSAVEKRARAPLTRDDEREEPPLFNDGEWQQKLEESTSVDLEAFIAETFERAVEDLGESWDDWESAFDTEIRSVLKSSTSKITEVVPRIKEELEKLLADNVGKPASEIKDLIRSKFDFYSEGRAGRIARTTATHASGASQVAAWKELDAEYSWLTQRDGSVRETHRAADGQRPDEDGNFHVGNATGPHPGAMSTAEESVECRCVLRARPKKEKE